MHIASGRFGRDRRGRRRRRRARARSRTSVPSCRGLVEVRGCRRGRRRGRARAPSTACRRRSTPRILRRSSDLKPPGSSRTGRRERHDHRPRARSARRTRPRVDAVAEVDVGELQLVGVRGAATTSRMRATRHRAISRPGSSIASTSRPSWLSARDELVGSGVDRREVADPGEWRAHASVPSQYCARKRTSLSKNVWILSMP